MGSSNEEQRDYSRKVLVVVSGLSPAVVTATFYALAVTAKPLWVPSEVYVVTTGAGLKQLEASLLDSVGANGRVRKGQFRALCEDYEIAGVKLVRDNIRVLIDEEGAVEDDAHSAQAMMRMGDLVVSTLCEFTSDENCAVHVSLAGGRKSMSYLAGTALSLVGRGQDVLSHVILSDPAFETAPGFYYPPKVPRDFAVSAQDENGLRATEQRSSRNVDVRLAEVPFVPLRYVLRDGVFRDKTRPTLSSLVTEVKDSLQPRQHTARFNTNEAWVELDGRRLKLTPAELALFYTIAKFGERGFSTGPNDDETVEYLEYLSLFSAEGRDYRRQKKYPPRVHALAEKWLGVESPLGEPVTAQHIQPTSGLSPGRASNRLKAKKAKLQPELSNIRRVINDALGPIHGQRFQPFSADRERIFWPVEIDIQLSNEPVNESTQALMKT